MRPLFLILLLSSFFTTLLIGQNVDVTFRVDMSSESVSPNGVHIAGNFQTPAGLGTNWNPGSTLVTDVNGDDIYEITVSLPPGTYEYKFINGNAWGMEENPPSDCSIGTTNNREVVVGNADLVLPAVPFNGCIVTLRLAVNMTGQTISPEGVHVMGDFQEAAGFSQNWDPASTRLEDLNRDGTYEAELTLPFGSYQYLFLNGNTTQAAEDLPFTCTVLGTNGSQNRTIDFDIENTATEVYCFNSCDLCHPSVVFDFDTYWWNDAIFYEILVRSFYDSNGDGIGDFRGVMEKLDYLNDGNPETHSDLGITGLWLMPMMKSPSYHGYDVDNYYVTETDYGSMEDFEALLDAAHERGIKVILDLVMNHSSSQHPWFTQSVNNTNGYRDWYIWADTNPGGIGPWGQTLWHPRNGDYYYGLFWSEMPDLNYRHLPVKEAMFDVVDFWLDKGVDGYRLDAIKYLVEDGNILENTTETFELIEELNTVYKTNNPDAFTVGEVWSSTSSIIPYVQNNRMDACFEFGLAGSILDAVNTGDPVNLEQQLETVLSSYPQLQYGTFLTNHDIDRVFSTLSNNVDKMKLAATFYLTLPGIPFIYYGEEVGLTGTGDHLNLRKPMQWSDKTHAGFSTVSPWNSIGGNYLTNNVEEMAVDPNSLLNHYRKLIRIRNEQEALRRGQTLQVTDDQSEVFSYARVLDDEAILVVTNTGTMTLDPLLSLERSSLAAGEYFVTELLSNQSIGKIEIDVNGGFANWQVEAPNLSGRSAWILLFSVENPITSTSDPVKQSVIKLMPNPANESFEITWDQHSNIGDHIQIFTSAGGLIFQAKAEGMKVDVKTGDWPAGIYMVVMKDPTGTETGRSAVSVVR